MIDLKGMTKDIVEAREGLQKYCEHSELTIKWTEQGKGRKPKACFTLKKDEKKNVLRVGKGIKIRR